MLNYVASNEVFFRHAFDYSLIHVTRDREVQRGAPGHLDLMVRTLDFLRNQGIQAHPIYREGDVAAEIVDAAEKLHVNMIVMGSRGHSALQSLMLGSVTTQVLTQARVPVLVVR